jgi:hypothetical protein
MSSALVYGMHSLKGNMQYIIVFHNKWVCMEINLS